MLVYWSVWTTRPLAGPQVKRFLPNKIHKPCPLRIWFQIQYIRSIMIFRYSKVFLRRSNQTHHQHESCMRASVVYEHMQSYTILKQLWTLEEFSSELCESLHHTDRLPLPGAVVSRAGHFTAILCAGTCRHSQSNSSGHLEVLENKETYIFWLCILTLF